MGDIDTQKIVKDKHHKILEIKAKYSDVFIEIDNIYQQIENIIQQIENEINDMDNQSDKNLASINIIDKIYNMSEEIFLE